MRWFSVIVMGMGTIMLYGSLTTIGYLYPYTNIIAGVVGIVYIGVGLSELLTIKNDINARIKGDINNSSIPELKNQR